MGAKDAVAERAKLSQQYIGGIENGKRNPTVMTLMTWPRRSGSAANKNPEVTPFKTRVVKSCHSA
ncbi:helix-turn-helix transcriptional regulator [Mesorhizobium australicum]|uniref:Helix-turn-helix transcriptional regulator n=1 Tax=Mesorhizobium australicum TaxID=536018 RepID=A0ACC6T7B9_9HYPH